MLWFTSGGVGGIWVVRSSSCRDTSQESSREGTKEKYISRTATMICLYIDMALQF